MVENRNTIFSLQTRLFAGRGVENNVDEIPLTQVISDGSYVLSPPLPLLVSGFTTPRDTIRSTERFSLYEY